MLRSLFQGGGEAEHFFDAGVGAASWPRIVNFAARRPLPPFCRNDVGDHGAAFGQGAGFVHDQDADFLRLLQRFRVSDQDARFRAVSRAHHDRGGGGEAQGAGAGDDQHRHGVDQGCGKFAADAPPQAESDEADGDHHRHENAGNNVRQALDRRFRALRLFHQADDAGQHGMAAHAGGAALQHALLVLRGGEYFRVKVFDHRQAFAGQHGFPHAGAAFNHFAVDRDVFAGADDEHIADLEAGGIDLDDFAIALDARGFWLEFDKFLDRRRSARLGTRLQQLAHQHQGDDGGAGFEINMLVEAEQGDGGAEEIRHAGAECDQHVHVGAATAQGVPGADVKAFASPELHRRGEQPLQPARKQLNMLAEKHWAHLGYQRQGKHCGNPENAQFFPVCYGAPLLFLRTAGADRFVSAVAGLGHCGNQRFQRGSARCNADAGFFSGEINRGADAVDLVQHLFNPCGAGGAGHAFQFQYHFLIGYGKTGFLDGLHQFGGRVQRRVEFDEGLFAGEIDRSFYAGQFVEVLFEARRTGRAGHAYDRKFNMLGGGGGHLSRILHHSHFPPCLPVEESVAHQCAVDDLHLFADGEHRFGFLHHGTVAAIIHADGDFVMLGGFYLLLDLVSGIAAAHSAGNGGDILSSTPADLVSQ